MRFKSKGKTVEVTNDGKVYIDGEQVSNEDATKSTNTRFIDGDNAPVNLGTKSWDWTA